MSLLHYTRHFLLLVCLLAALAAADRWGLALGMTYSVGIYAILHAAAVAASLRAPEPAWKRPLFVVAATSLCVLGVSASVQAGRYVGALPGMAKPALVLTMAAAAGAAGYAILIRQCFSAMMLTLRTVTWVSLGCIAASLAVLAGGLYRHGGVLWFAAAWWFAFSIGLWCADRRTPRA